MEVTLRRVRSEEIDLLCKLDVQIFKNDAFDTPEYWEGLEKFFIIVGGQIIGSVAMQHNTGIAEHYDADYLEQPGSLYIVSTGLLPEWQGKGIGKEVKKWQIQYAKEHGFSRIVTNARVSNYRSIIVNKHCGFKVACIIPDWYDEPTEDAMVLELKL